MCSGLLKLGRRVTCDYNVVQTQLRLRLRAEQVNFKIYSHLFYEKYSPWILLLSRVSFLTDVNEGKPEKKDKVYWRKSLTSSETSLRFPTSHFSTKWLIHRWKTNQSDRIYELLYEDRTTVKVLQRIIY